jgi:hypothetical protein
MLLGRQTNSRERKNQPAKLFAGRILEGRPNSREKIFAGS